MSFSSSPLLLPAPRPGPPAWGLDAPFAWDGSLPDADTLKALRPYAPPFFTIVDEFGFYAQPSMRVLFQKSRSFNAAPLMATQSLGNFGLGP
jgi:hypothetical protein